MPVIHYAKAGPAQCGLPIDKRSSTTNDRGSVTCRLCLKRLDRAARHPQPRMTDEERYEYHERAIARIKAMHVSPC